MARPMKGRQVCRMPGTRRFGPSLAGGDTQGDILLTVDEYEAIRLIDHLGLKQEECALQMEVGRTTVTAIYASARHKLARALVEGLNLSIQGGAYRLGEHQQGRCGPGCQQGGPRRGRRGRGRAGWEEVE